TQSTEHRALRATSCLVSAPAFASGSGLSNALVTASTARFPARSQGRRRAASSPSYPLLLLLTLASTWPIHQPSTTATMSKSRMPLILGLGAAGAIGYYFYSAGGNAKAAENKLESHVHKASASVKSRFPGSSPDADKQPSRLKSNAEAYAKDAKAEARKAVDKLDRKVDEGAAKAKTGIFGWFGRGGK
ncbi:Uncharacterized protein TCAP_03874, partial [Tolypocladium capitatum]